MDNGLLMLAFLRKLICLALLGFVVVMVSGPLFAVLGILIGFAMIGLLVWVPMRCMGFGRPIEWHRVREVGKKCWGPVAGGCNRLGGELLIHGQPYLERVRETGRFLARLAREMMSGAVVGAMLGLIPALHHGNDLSILPGIVLGALLGVGVGLFAKPQAVKSCQVLHPPFADKSSPAAQPL